MKKQLRLLFAISAVLLLLVVGTFWLNLYQPESESPTPSSVVGSSIMLLEKTTEDIFSVTVQNNAASYSIQRSRGQWVVDALMDAPMIQDRIESTVNALAHCVATVVTKTPGGFSDYGLEQPAAAVEAVHDKGSLKLLLGDRAPTGAGLYAKQPDSDTVYLLSSEGLHNLLDDPISFIDTTITGGDIGTETIPLFETMTLGGSLRPESLILEQSPPNEYGMAQISMVAPKARSVKLDLIPEKLSSVMNISAERVVEYKPDETALIEYGLDNPYSTVSVTYPGKDGKAEHFTLLATRPKEGRVFVLREGVTVVYEVSAEALPWLELTYPDLLSPLLLLPNIMDVSSVTVMAGATQWVYELTLSGEDVTVLSNGIPVSTDRFKKLYQTLIGLPAEQYTTELPPVDAKKTIMTITYQYHDASHQSDTLALLEGPVMQLYLSINGETEFLTKSKYIDVILENIKNLPNPDKAMLELY